MSSICYTPKSALGVFSLPITSDVNKDLTHKDKDKDKDQASKDKDKDQTNKDKDKDLNHRSYKDLQGLILQAANIPQYLKRWRILLLNVKLYAHHLNISLTVHKTGNVTTTVKCSQTELQFKCHCCTLKTLRFPTVGQSSGHGEVAW
jgi:hypothetical protein